MSYLIVEMLNAGRESCVQMRTRITNVRWHGDGIAFEFDGVTSYGQLRGRNRDLLIGHGKEQDTAIALRCLLDGDATPTFRSEGRAFAYSAIP